MDYEKLMNQAMKFIELTMKSYDDLVKQCKEKGDSNGATRYTNKYIAIRDVKVGIDQLALDMKNGE